MGEPAKIASFPTRLIAVFCVVSLVCSCGRDEVSEGEGETKTPPSAPKEGVVKASEGNLLLEKKDPLEVLRTSEGLLDQTSDLDPSGLENLINQLAEASNLLAKKDNFESQIVSSELMGRTAQLIVSGLNDGTIDPQQAIRELSKFSNKGFSPRELAEWIGKFHGKKPKRGITKFVEAHDFAAECSGDLFTGQAEAEEKTGWYLEKENSIFSVMVMIGAKYDFFAARAYAELLKEAGSSAEDHSEIAQMMEQRIPDYINKIYVEEAHGTDFSAKMTASDIAKRIHNIVKRGT